MSNSGFKFDNTYANLPEIMATKLSPVAVKKPELVILNHDLARSLGLDFSKYTNHENAEIFSGNKLIDGSIPLAQAYCGHQFGHFVMLGDGRAILLGEHIDPKNQRWDIHLQMELNLDIFKLIQPLTVFLGMFCKILQPRLLIE